MTLLRPLPPGDARAIIARILLACLLLGLSHGSAGDSLPDLVERIRPGVVGIGAAYPPRQPRAKGYALVYAGTGFAVGDGRHVVTNAHVVDLELDEKNRQFLAVFTGHGATARVRRARVLRRDDIHDLALLQFDGPALTPLALGSTAGVREGQAVAFTGFPIGMALGLYPATHRGTIAAITPVAQPLPSAGSLNAVQVARVRNQFDVFQLDATAYPGNSGSPVFELDSGRVIAVLNSVFTKESRESLLSSPSGISYAIPVRHILPLLESQGVPQ